MLLVGQDFLIFAYSVSAEDLEGLSQKGAQRG